ncbi:GntR family transcriptional regulator [Staphylococcus coagulans]|uniref:GntR family transcriptional regulator n=1 Tax=Staphylococcus coagulans TaxID=74706 RepID=A0ABU1F122_9STAP|nr:GntR family transcriptional regulator [Staphylococcus coagulans]MDR5603823.1 GntR family transcriptional regulator [Staphylococcus coagulans]MDR9833017.1 GntR family transcriptional regulator [Staphylococcus coagulans]
MASQSQPKFLTIYNTLYEEIQIGKYPSGQALPTEKTLCQRFQVSRMTLRQAIKLLVEDGIVESTRGKGHFVLRQKVAHQTSSMGLLKHPLQQVSIQPVSLTSMHYRVDLESEYTNHLFPNHPTAVIAMERYYQHTQSTNAASAAFCFSFIPLHVIDTFKINTQSEQAMRDFVENTVYQNSTQSNLKISITPSPSFQYQHYTFEGGKDCWLIIETIYAQNQSPIMINKWYIPQENAELILSRIQQ